MEALKKAVDDPKLILNKVTSLCTDGTNVNTGETNSLWALMDKELKSSGIPLIKIWCAVHRSELAWKNTARTVPEISTTLSTLSSVSTYFHYSPLRIAELKKIANAKNLKLLNIPKIFEIRWSQFTIHTSTKYSRVMGSTCAVFRSQQKRFAMCWISALFRKLKQSETDRIFGRCIVHLPAISKKTTVEQIDINQHEDSRHNSVKIIE